MRLREALGIGALGQGEDLIDESELRRAAPASSWLARRARRRAARRDELGRDESRPHDAPRRRSCRATRSSLEALLAAAPDRDGAGRAPLALARRHVEAAALLVVHRGMVMGLFGAGGELERHIEAVLVPIDADSRAWRAPPPAASRFSARRRRASLDAARAARARPRRRARDRGACRSRCAAAS